MDQAARAILIIGGPGSGKTTISRAFLDDGLIRIDPDAIREGLPEYENLARHGENNLVDLTREKTSAITDDLLEDTIQHGKDFVFDASGRDKEWYLGLIQDLREKFEVTVVMVFTRSWVARQRCDKRAVLNARYVDNQFFSTSHEAVPHNFIDYLQSAHRFILIHNNDDKPRWVWYSTSNGEVVTDRQFLDSYFTHYVPGESKMSPPSHGKPLTVHDRWFEEVRVKMEAMPGWDLKLETRFRLGIENKSIK